MALHQVNVLRLVSTVTDIDDVIRTVDAKGNPLPGARVLSLPDVEGLSEISAKACYRESFRQLTQDDVPWIKFINERVVGNPIEFQASSKHPSGCVVLRFSVNEQVRFFALTFGQGGEALIEPNLVDREFGLLAAMNITKDGDLRRVQTSIHEIVSTQAERQISSGGSLSSFNIDGERELLRKIAGKATAEFDFIKNFTGREGLSFKVSDEEGIPWEGLLTWIASLDAAAGRTEYQTLFPEYDNFIVEKRKDVEDLLDQEIFERIRTGDVDKIALAPPEFIDFDELHFCYHVAPEIYFDDLSLQDWLNVRSREFRTDSSIKTIKSAKVFAENVNTGARIRTWSVYRCLVAEITREDGTFVLSMGQWRRVSSTLRAQTDQAIANIPIVDLDYLPGEVSIWVPDGGTDVLGEPTGENRESAYNDYVSDKSNELFLFDKAKIEIAGEKRYEVCDLLHLSKKFIHLKRLRSSSASVSHLFVQARFYADALLSDARCRIGIRQHISNKSDGEDVSLFLNIIPELRSDLIPNEYTVVFAMLVDSPMTLADLPFMARYELVRAYRYLVDTLGFRCVVTLPLVKLGPA